ncbi:MAG: hypothetical protein EON59_16985 [Alphaproteobacteria bacterium]|nr:MAG: hypothetical protein EON59_16985 [Alphaproteobacteria bacterium]
MERNETLIAENGARRIFSFEKKDPEGIWNTCYRGRELMRTREGEVLEAPSDPLFASEDKAREWLQTAAPLG